MAARSEVRLGRASGDSFGLDDLSCAAATQLGLFAAEGLQVRWSDWRGGVAAMRAALEGAVDVAYAGYGPVVALRAEGHPCRIFVSQARALAQALVTRRGVAAGADLRGALWAVDGIGALSHHMARLVVRALGIAESDIRWDPVGPPPLRIRALLEGRADASLVRAEEALSLHRNHADRVHQLLGFDELKRLVPMQPHGVLATTEDYEREHPEVLGGLTRAMLLASRRLHDEYDTFCAVMRAHVSVPLEEEDLRLLWTREHASGGWAVNGALVSARWDAALADYGALHPGLRAVSRAELIAGQFVPEALRSIGAHPAEFDRPES